MRRLRGVAHTYALRVTLCAVLAACGGIEVQPAGATPGDSALRADLQALVDEHRIPGASAVIERDNVVLARETVGWLDVEKETPLPDDAIYRLFSMSKPITSVAIMMLVEQGKLALDDPVERSLPELHDMRVFRSGTIDDMQTEPLRRPITIRDLLTHTSGIVYHFTGNSPVHQYYRRNGVMRDTPVGRTPDDGPPARTLDELVARIGKAPLLHQPGSQFHYSYSTTVLGAVVERITGKKLGEALAELLFTPLGMTDTGFFVEEPQLPRFTTLYTATDNGLAPVEQPSTSDYRDHGRLLDGGGALVSTVGDYLRFARMLAQGGALDGRRYLTAAHVDTLFTPHVTIDGLGDQHTPFALGFAIGDSASNATHQQPSGSASWSGSGNTYFFVDPSRRAVAILMTHVLTPGATAERTATIRAVVNRAADRLLTR